MNNDRLRQRCCEKKSKLFSLVVRFERVLACDAAFTRIATPDFASPHLDENRLGLQCTRGMHAEATA